MKKKFLATAVLAAAMAIAGPAYAADDIAVTVNGNPLTFDVAPQIVDGRTMVPMRAIFEEFGMVVDWDGSDRTIFARNGETSIRMQIDNKMSTKNGVQVENDVAPMVLDGRTMVPLRFIATALDMNPNWNGETRTVEIVTEDDSYKEYRAWYETDKQDNLWIKTNMPAATNTYTTQLEAIFGDHTDIDADVTEGTYINYRFSGGFLACNGPSTVNKIILHIYNGNREKDVVDSRRSTLTPDAEFQIDKPLHIVSSGNAVKVTSATLIRDNKLVEITPAEPVQKKGYYNLLVNHDKYIYGTPLKRNGDILYTNWWNDIDLLNKGKVYILYTSCQVEADGSATMKTTPESTSIHFEEKR